MAAPGPWRVRFTPLADADVTEAYEYDEGSRAGVGARFLDGVGDAVVLLGEHPEAGPVAHRALRRLLVHGFPYSLYDRLDAAEWVVEVRACVHQRRHPGTWRRRA